MINIDAKQNIEKYGQKLFDYQKGGVEFLAGRQTALLADEMGLGKTVQALVALPENAAALVVVPASVKLSWVREVAAWRPDLTVSCLKGRKSFRFPQAGEVVVVNYDILPKVDQEGRSWVIKDLATPVAGTVLIADEAHKVKSPKARRTRSLKCVVDAVLGQGGRAWAMTGTPLLNRPPELWSVLGVFDLDRAAYRHYGAFKSIFGGQKGRWGIEWPTRPADEDAAIEGFRNVALRRQADDHLNLPSLRETVKFVECDRKTLALCDSLQSEIEANGIGLDDAVDLAIESRNGVGFEELSAARAALATAKMPALLDIASEYEEAGEPLIVFSAHRAAINTLSEREGWARISGSEDADQRGEVVAKFQRGELKGVAITIGAGAEGITLTRARTVIFLDRAWTPGVNQQAAKRAHRIGQDRPVEIIDLVADHGIDERVHELLVAKSNLIASVIEKASIRVGDAEVEDNTPSDVTEDDIIDQLRTIAEGLEGVDARIAGKIIEAGTAATERQIKVAHQIVGRHA
jgi:SWI/SNF-related matrix-associated actin-dependent regulator 1 of chromatin subfamily A